VLGEQKPIPDHSGNLGHGLGEGEVLQLTAKECLLSLAFSARGGRLGDFLREYIHAALFGIFCKATDRQQSCERSSDVTNRSIPKLEKT
jgi:hypothetical protein